MKYFGLFILFLGVNISIYAGGGKEIELVNEQKMQIGGIQNINVSYRDTDIALLKSNVSSLVIKEYMSSNKNSYYAGVANSGSTMNIIGGKRPVFYPFLFMILFKARTEIYLPESYTGNITIKTVDGSIQVNNSLSFETVTFETRDGNINAQNISARNIKLRSVDGSIRCGSINGNVELNARDGRTFVENINGNISAEVKDGNIELLNIKGSARVKARDGNIQCTVVEPFGEIALETIHGRVTLNIPKNMFFNFSARTSSRITTPFTDSLSRPATDNHLFQGIIETGNVPIDVNISTRDGRVNVNWAD